MTHESFQPTQKSSEDDLDYSAYSAYLFGLDEDGNDPILALDSRSRAAFLLHHLSGYKIEDAALLAEISEEEFRKHLHSAYLQLAPLQFGTNLHLSATGEPALAWETHRNWLKR